MSRMPSRKSLPLSLMGALVVGFAATAVVGCGGPPRATFYYAEPAPMSYGGNNHLLVVQVEGPRSVRDEFREEMLRELTRMARDEGYWVIQDRTNAGARIETNGHPSSSLQAGDREVLARFDVHNFKAEVTTYNVTRRERAGTDAEGRPIYTDRVEQRTGMQGQCHFSVTTLHGTNEALMRGREFNETVSRKDTNAAAAKETALRRALRDFLDTITPRMRRAYARLDDRYDDMKDVVSLAVRREFGAAEAQLQSMKQQYPDRPDVLYNLAVVLDAMGRYDEAGPLYDQAINLGGRDFYTNTRTAFHSRVQAATTMQQ